jgi:hypothetical protein
LTTPIRRPRDERGGPIRGASNSSIPKTRR